MYASSDVVMLDELKILLRFMQAPITLLCHDGSGLVHPHRRQPPSTRTVPFPSLTSNSTHLALSPLRPSTIEPGFITQHPI